MYGEPNLKEPIGCSCREKKDTEVHSLESSREVESESISELEQKNEELRESLAGVKHHYAKMLEFAKRNNIKLRPRNIPGIKMP